MTAARVRAGEELDAAAVDAWLKPRLPGLSGSPRVTQFSGGASNWTYLLEYESDDLVLRRPPGGTKAKSAHDMRREFRVQQALHPIYPYVPEMIAFCDEPTVIGCDFYVMRRIPGLVPRARLPEGLVLDPPSARALCLSFVDLLVQLHGVDARAAGLESLGKGEGYARRQIEGWSARYDAARTWNVPRFAKVTAWLRANAPDDVATCVIHNDFRLDNVVLVQGDSPGESSNAPARIVGVLDWEMATLGDPLMDLGNSLAYWVEAGDDPVARATRRQPTTLPGMLTRKEIAAAYFEKSGLAPRDTAFYEVYGLFRLAAIAQQIYFRYHRGETRNPSFRRFWLLAHYLAWRCSRLM